MVNRGLASKSNERAASYARQRQQHEAASTRVVSERQRAADSKRASNALLELESSWGSRVDALYRLREISETVDRLRSEQQRALLERDELILRLRQVGETWNSLAARTGLSRQALTKRGTGLR